jgi:hypothetical protein
MIYAEFAMLFCIDAERLRHCRHASAASFHYACATPIAG